MYLNTIKPGLGSKKSPKRLGRGIGSGLGKTSGKGHKGQKARSGGYHKVGFEGGQMPLQRRLPKRGFVSLTKNQFAVIRTEQLNLLDGIVTLNELKALKLIPKEAKGVKIFLKGDVTKKLTVKGVKVSKGAKAAIERVGGSIE